MLELFVVGSFWFWALIAAEILLLFIFVEYENGIGATISVIVFAALLQWCGNVDIIKYVIDNPFMVIGLVLSYLGLGTVWGVIKWRLYCGDRLELYESMKTEFLVSKGLPPNTKVVPVNLREEWKSKVERTRNYHNGQTIADVPLAKSHKSMIVNWMAFWVISMIWSFVNDFVKRIYKEIYRKIANFLQRIASNLWNSAQVDEDLNVPQRDRD